MLPHDIRHFITKKLAPTVLQTINSTISVRPLRRPIVLKKKPVCFDVVIPNQVRNAKIKADLVVFLTTKREKHNRTIASSTACFFHPYTGR